MASRTPCLWRAPPALPPPRPTTPPPSSTPTGPAITVCGTVRAARPPGRRRLPAGAFLRWGRLAEAREQLTAAAQVLRAAPDADTVSALDDLASLAVHSGVLPDADRLSTEALVLGQALGVGVDQLVSLFVTRGVYLISTGRRPESVAYFREGARLATQTGASVPLGRALINLSDVLAATDPKAAEEAARTAIGHLRRAGARDYLATAVTNLVQALMMLGDWGAAEAELIQAMDSDGLADIEYVACYRGLVAALHGDVTTAEAVLAGLHDLRGNEDTQSRAQISLVEAFTAAARRRPEDALRHARDALAHTDALGISHENLRWAWPLAARAAHELNDAAAVRELLALLDARQPGTLAPMLRAERDLVRARLAAADFTAAVSGLRELSTPYHLAHGLLDYAGYLTRQGDVEAAALAIGEARGIGQQLQCEPLMSRAADMASPESHIPA